MIAAATPAMAAADASETGIDEVVVTAQRRSEAILQVPVAVSAVAGQDLAARHVAHMSDLTNIAPNVEISSGRGSTLTDVAIRGVGVANDFSQNQASPVGVYLDDSYFASRAFSGAQAFDLERVEILRGPQGTLFGRNTTGGLINFITRGPQLAGDNGRVEAGYGNYSDVRVQGAYEHTFATDVFGVRAAATYQRHDGYYHNIAPGQPDVDDLDTMAGRIEARWKPTEGLDVTAKVYGQRDKNFQWAQRAKLVGGDAELPPGRFDVDLTPGTVRSTSAGAHLKILADLAPGWTLTHLTSYDHGALHLDGVDYDGMSTGPTVPGFTQEFQRTKFKQVNEELRLNYDGQDLHAVVGAYYGEDEQRANDHYDLFTVLPVSPQFRYEQKRVSKAAFAQVDYNVLENLTLTGGLRFTHDTIVYRNGHADVAIPLVPGGLLNTLPGAGTPDCPALVCPDAVEPTHYGASDALTGRAAVKYTFADGQIVYASYSRGYRGGAFNGIAYLSPAQLFFVKPEVVNAYEVGAKGRFLDGRAHLSAAAFYNDYKNQQVNFLQSIVTALGPFPVDILENVPKARTLGLEFEGDIAVTDQVTVNGTLGLLDAKYDGGAVVNGEDLSHNRLPYSPRVSGTLGLNWRMGELAGGDVTLAPNVTYSSSYFFAPNNNPDVATSGYTRVNATLSWQRDELTVRLWGNNLFNEKYNSYGVDESANTGAFLYTGAPPRTYGVTLTREF